MNFKRVNNITGWVVCLIACVVFIMTSEAGGSFWDCGEFVSSCFKVQIPHPPGAPLFILLGRIAIILTGSNPLTAAKSVNVLNAFASGFTILFLFWTITHFARKLVHTDKTQELTKMQIFSIMAAGAVGGLAYTFCDSFWYSAVEGEVYAFSSFFTAIVFWCIVRWEDGADDPGADKWLILIFFLIGLSIGVHLLCLLTVPSIVLTYYYKKRARFDYKKIKKYFIRTLIVLGVLGVIASLLSASGKVNAERGVPFDGTMAGVMIVGTLLAIGFLYLVEYIAPKDKKELWGGAFIFLVIGTALEGVVQVGVIQYSIVIAGQFDVFFVNSMHMPYFYGFAFFFVILAVAIWWALRFAAKKDWYYMKLGLWCFTFLLIGYSSYLTTMIRSNADPAIDMYNVDNPISLAGYLGRQQYGDWPLLYGQKFVAQPLDNKPQYDYEKTSHGYIKAFSGYSYSYDPKDMMVFPRMWDNSNEQGHADYYAMFMDVGKNKDGSYDIPKDDDGHYTRPNFADNVGFFLSYQSYFMFFRYFMWNFSGKENDIEGLFTGNPRDGNWITGIPFIDNAMYGDQSLMPDTAKANKSHNTMFALPFILGFIGLFYHFKKRGDDAFIAFVLFLFTGFLIIIYLNQAGFQPRERDYAYAGSFYAFSIWVGLGILYFIDMASKWDKKLLINTILIPCGVVSLLFLIVGARFQFGLAPGIGFAALFFIVAAGIPYALKSLKSAKAIIITASLIGLCVTLLMGQQEWDDHDRSNKQLARDLAKDYLESCPQNAILFTYGDNDTYPLWYAQEVEGIRPDIRVINTSLLGIDWYINQFRYKINQSAPIDVIWNAEQIEGGKRDAVLFRADPAFPDDRYYKLYDMMKDYTGSDDPAKMQDEGEGNTYNTFPGHKVSVPVDEAVVRANGTVNPTDSIVKEVRFTIPKNVLYKGDLAMLDIIAANNWKRPICFTMNQAGLGFDGYLRKNGMSYQLVPVENSPENTDFAYNVVMNKFGFGNAQIPGVYYDEENRRHLLDIRQACSQLALDLADKNRKDDARKVLEKTDKMMLQQNMPYGLISRQNDHDRVSMMFLEACYRANDSTLANKVYKAVKKDFQQQVMYYNSLTGNMAEFMQSDKDGTEQLNKQLDQVVQMFTMPQLMSPPQPAALKTDTAAKPSKPKPDVSAVPKKK